MSQASFFRIRYAPFLVLIALTFFSTALFSGQGFCATVDLAWDKPSDTSNIAGYNIYVAPSGSSFPNDATSVIQDPNQTTCSISGLTEGAIYGFVATSYDAEGNESTYSNEVYYTVPTSTQDSDGDGLTDADEEYYGLDPYNPDTTGNGLPDAFEVEFWGEAWDEDMDGDGTVNLFDLDADGDGVSDTTELVQGTDPADGSDNEPGLPTMVFGEVPVDSDWTTVELDKTFQNPVVVAGPLSSNDSQPAVVRIRNISGNSFDIRAQEYEYLTQTHTQEIISFVVMEMGSYYLPDGTQIEASYFEAQANHSSFDPVSFSSQFAVQPVVMTSITTVNDQLAVTGRMQNVSTSGFDYALQPEEFSENDHTPESVAYIAWEPSKGEIDGTQFEVAMAHDLTHNAQDLEFEQPFAKAPSFLASMLTCNGGDTSNLRYEKKSNRGLKVNVAEEQSLDDEVNHTNEDVGYIAFNTVQKKVVYAVNCGGDAYTNSNGVSYNADENFTYGKTSGTSSEIEGTEDDPVYQTERYGDFYYDITLDDGDYTVTLQFAEIYWSNTGQRVFDVWVEGQKVVSDLDLVKKVGSMTAYEVNVPASVTDGELNIEFFTDIDNAKASGIIVTASDEQTSSDIVYAVNCGGDAYTDANGISYNADENFLYGTTAKTSSDISGTEDDPVYQTERYGDFYYDITLDDGDYTVTLQFAEIYWSNTGQRVFDVWVEGQQVVSDLDLVKKVGGKTVYAVNVPVSVSDGELNIEFSTDVDNAKASGIVVSSTNDSGDDDTEPSQSSTVYAVNCGGSSYTDSNGVSYDADENFTYGRTAKTSSDISGTDDDPIYQTERYGDFFYDIPLEDGDYTVTLQFAEFYWSNTGKRVFDVWVEGKQVVSDLDLIKKVGSKTVYAVNVPVSVSDGELNIEFATDIDNAKASGIVVVSN